MEDQVSMGLTMQSIMTADLMWRIVSILTQRGRNSMSIGTAIRVIVCRMMKTKEQDLLSQKLRKRIMLRNIQIMWTDRMKEIERHVFDVLNQYGELCPQQDKALEELGFELPKPNEKKGKYNNRKMVFDDECRKLFISICQKHGLNIDVEPVYGGASYLEKQDFIIMNQQKRIDEKQAILEGLVMKIEDVNAVVEEAVDLAYEKACEVVTERVKERN
jgi:hypothetical protein